ncbi:Siroheme synthase [Methylibium sp. T29]|nr:Siroheme synthase [Methylibium sp. T29]EWS59986.1 Siroheme synthase [Methylibium sp. T29-B]
MTAEATAAYPHAGMVSIVGAGPGPADLLTLRALDRIRQADVVVHDRLIDAEVLALIPPAAQRIYVGKAAGHHMMTQAQIHAVLVEQARRGRRVVRLKGGDPHIFGRGGEEVQALQAEDLAFEVVPGVSAANGCAATAGIPLTHRDLSHSCTFLPGHLAGSSPELDWAALARPRQTRVFYMGVERVPAIARALIAHGLHAGTPAAIVQDGTREGQRVWAMGLAALAEQAPAYGPRPGLLIIGETVSLSPHFVQDDGAPAPAAGTTELPSPGLHFNVADRTSLYRVLAARRDMRHFARGTPMEDAVLQRMLHAAHAAPSVGLMQPWRFVRVLDPVVRERIAALVDGERRATADALGERRDEFLRLKVEGVRDCAELLVAVLAPDDGTVFGRRTLPREMALCSVGCAVENLWLAARAENLGLGWVSMFDPAALGELLALPEGALALGVLCLGPVRQFYGAPMLELEGWRDGRPLAELLFVDRWGQQGQQAG